MRIGNGAWNQRQLDVYGELLGAAHRLRDQLGTLAPEPSRPAHGRGRRRVRRWREPDQGIWEMRDEPRHFLHSKLMCWVALDRAVELAGALGADAARVGRWQAERDRIRARHPGAGLERAGRARSPRRSAATRSTPRRC